MYYKRQFELRFLNVLRENAPSINREVKKFKFIVIRHLMVVLK